MKGTILGALVLASVSGCATPYQSNGIRGGYNEVQLDKNVFRVSFQGNAYTAPRKVTDYILLRSAELTLQNGFRYFQVAGLSDETVRTSVPLPATANTTVVGNQASTTITGGGFLGFTFPSASQVIVCYKEKPQSYAFDAEFLAGSLGRLYGKASPSYSRETVPQAGSDTTSAEQSPARTDCVTRVISAGGKPIPKDEQC
jgi:hypothetical protein